jgi:type II secretory pathway pseudopilin PulG
MKQNKGFTIIELLVYSVLLVMFLAILSNLFLSSIDIKIASEGASYQGQDARAIIERFNYDFLRASAVTSPTLGASSGTLSLTISGSATSYALSNGKLAVTDNSGTYNLNGSETTVSALNFETLGNTNGKRSVKMTFTINDQTYVTTFGTR